MEAFPPDGSRISQQEDVPGGTDDDQILLGNRNKFDQWFVVKFGTEADIVFLLFQSGEDIAGKNLITEQIERICFPLLA